MMETVKRLSLGIGLIAAVSAFLLLSDWKSRAAPGPRAPRVALFQIGSQVVLDETAQGAIDGLARKGFVDGKSVRLQRFNAQGDFATANNIAKAILDARFDMVITLTTPCLQAMAGANRQGKILHVFGAVTDPAGAGVGISRTDPLGHPRHLVGIGTFEPVREVMRLARRLNPGLKVAGVVWNPGEACSEACVRLGREVARELGMRLLEANVENSAGVSEAAASVIARGAEALIMGGDNTVELAKDAVIKEGLRAGIPTFGYEPACVNSGALAGLGANYPAVGRITGELAGDILNGRDPRTVRIENVLPKTLALNLATLAKLRGNWRIPPEVMASADFVIDAQGRRTERKAQAAAVKKWKIEMIELVEAPSIDESRRGVLAGLREAGLVEGRDYELRVRNAQGDMPTLSSMIDAAITAQADMIYTITTPALETAMTKVHDRPILFTLALDPLLVGDTGTHENHRADVAGVYDRSPFEGMMKLVRQCIPRARRIGTLFAPAEANSVNFREEMEKAAREAGFELVAVPSSSAAEVNDSALALTQRGIDVICQINDNLHDAAFPSIARAAERARIPLFGFSTGQIGRGAALVLSNDHFDGGRESALIAARVMRGESPGRFPYQGIRRTRLLVNPEAARAVGLTIPEGVMKRAEKR
jgi:ABC-type uncharacterized transport system substrate-binding protein